MLGQPRPHVRHFTASRVIFCGFLTLLKGTLGSPTTAVEEEVGLGSSGNRAGGASPITRASQPDLLLNRQIPAAGRSGW
jgi:hypothetical protein